MKTSDVSLDDLSRSVLAVPPLARHTDYTLNIEANRAMIRYLEAGGVSTILYGGNANLYNTRPSEYAAILAALREAAGSHTWIIPAVGPSYGVFMDQAEVLRDFDFPTVMVLPAIDATTSAGVVEGLRQFAERFGKPIVIYLKREGYLRAEDVKDLFDDGVACALKYAVVRPDPSEDRLLSDLCSSIDRRRIVSGIGERPAITHVRDFGLDVFTSGSVCVGPRQSLALLRALRNQDYAFAERLRAGFLPLEDLRDAINPIRVLHDAVSLAEIADMGPLLPLTSNLSDTDRSRVTQAARALAQREKTLA